MREERKRSSLGDDLAAAADGQSGKKETTEYADKRGFVTVLYGGKLCVAYCYLLGRYTVRTRV